MHRRARLSQRRVGALLAADDKERPRQSGAEGSLDKSHPQRGRSTLLIPAARRGGYHGADQFFDTRRDRMIALAARYAVPAVHAFHATALGERGHRSLALPDIGARRRAHLPRSADHSALACGCADLHYGRRRDRHPWRSGYVLEPHSQHRRRLDAGRGVPVGGADDPDPVSAQGHGHRHLPGCGLRGRPRRVVAVLHL
jgi:hypothetical protein